MSTCRTISLGNFDMPPFPLGDGSTEEDDMLVEALSGEGSACTSDEGGCAWELDEALSI